MDNKVVISGYPDLDIKKFKEYLVKEAGNDQSSLLRLYYDMLNAISRVMNAYDDKEITKEDIDYLLGSMTVFDVNTHLILKDLKAIAKGESTIAEKEEQFSKMIQQ